MTGSKTSTRKRHVPPSQSKAPSIALCVIAKNEEEFLGDCLDSVRSFVNEMVVVDTGSTDATREIAVEHGARLVEFAWCDDFAAARNAAIEATTADWILMLDADEELDPTSGLLLGWHAAQLPAGMIGYAVTIENRRRDSGEADWVRHAVTRFFPRRDTLRFVGAIHEDLINLPNPGKSTAQLAPAIRIFHYGYDPVIYAKREKDHRNLRLLEVEYARNPENARTLYYLGQQHFVAGRHPDAVHYFELFAERADRVAAYFLVDAYRMWLEALVALDDEAELERVSRQAEERDALSALSRELLATYDMECGRLGSALRHLMAALNPEAPRGITSPQGAGTWRTRLLLAAAHERMGEPEMALAELEQAFADVPARLKHEIARQATQLAARNDQAQEADGWYARAKETAFEDLQTHQDLLALTLALLGRLPRLRGVAQLERMIALEAWQDAYEVALNMPLGSLGALAAILHLASRLREEGAPDAAVDVLGRAMDAHPQMPAVYWQLIQTFKDLERADDALAAIEVLQQLDRAA